MVLLLCQHQGRTVVSCPHLVLSGLALWVSTVGWPFFFVVGPSVFLVVPAGWARFVGVGGGRWVGGGVRWCVYCKFLPEQRQSRPVFPTEYTNLN